MQDREVF